MAEAANSYWQLDARCIGADPNIFFQEHLSTSRQEARSFCVNCFVRYECYNMGGTDKEGMWGGFTLEERLSHRKKRTAFEDTMRELYLLVPPEKRPAYLRGSMQRALSHPLNGSRVQIFRRGIQDLRNRNPEI
jgi:hypothetical protein